MAAWAGFSEEDLKKMKQMSNPSNAPVSKKPPEARKQSNIGQERRPPSRRPVKSTPQLADTSMMLQKPQNTDRNQNVSSRMIPKEKSQETECTNDVSQTAAPPAVNQPEEKDIKIEDLNDQEALSRDMMSLEKFRDQQKAIEEANKQKKALLSKTLTERRKMAQKEAYKLEHIQKELSKLDHLLTADVQVIRHKIEDSSRDYLEAQKRFEKAEVEYVASKMDLHEKSELKEQLTEHLYTIIHQNEVRKARKLAELMKELEMENNDEELQLPELPPLTSFQPSTVPLSPVKPMGVNLVLTEQNKSSNPADNDNSSNIGGDSNNLNPTDCSTGKNIEDNNKSVKAETITAEDNTDTSDELDKPEDSSPVTLKVESQVDGEKCKTIKVGQTSKLLSEMKENVNKELEAVDELIIKTETDSNPDSPPAVTTSKIPSKWDFDGNIT